MESTVTLVLTLVSLGWWHELPPAEAHLSPLVLEHLFSGASLILTSWLLILLLVLLVEVKRHLRPTFSLIIILSIWLILVSTLSLGLISRLLLPVIIIGGFIVAIVSLILI